MHSLPVLDEKIRQLRLKNEEALRAHAVVAYISEATSHATQLKQEEAEKSRQAEIEYQKSLKEKQVAVAAKQEYQARRAENIKQEEEHQKVCKMCSCVHRLIHRNYQRIAEWETRREAKAVTTVLR